MLKCCYSGKKYLSKLKQHGLPHILSEEFLLKCLSVMIYEQFVSIVELIMLSWQLILLHNFHNMRVTWLFYHFFKLQVHILHRLGNIWIFNIWKLWLVRCDVISVERASYYRRCPKLSEVRRFPFGDSLTQLSSLITRERLDRFQRYAYCSPAFWTLFHMKSTCFRVAVLLLVKQFPSKGW